eukprot:365960-Chlamydomonas_euryale.AAC.2
MKVFRPPLNERCSTPQKHCTGLKDGKAVGRMEGASEAAAGEQNHMLRGLNMNPCNQELV